ncbi:MAG: DUF4345 family protein [Gemmatimonadetes bacterium]|nr:DUF4345 family protein [Gemmatimonadota bacterium]
MKAFLAVNAVMYTVFALWCTLQPRQTAEFLGLSLPGPPALSEFTAVYGGLEAGMAAFFALGLLKPSLRKAVLVFALCLYAGLFVFRTTVVVRYGAEVGNTLGAYGLELVFLVWAVILSRKHLATPTA